MLKRMLSAFVCLCLLVTGTASSLAEAPAAHQLEKKTVPIYAEGMGKAYDEVPLWLVDGVTDLPYMDLKTLPEFLNAFWSVLYEDETPVQRYSGEYDASLQRYTLIYTVNGAAIHFNVESGSLIFVDYELMNYGAESQPLDLLNNPEFTVDGEPYLFQRVLQPQMIRKGDFPVISLPEYGIEFITQGDQILLPMQTLLDILLAMPYGGLLCYNGEALFLGGSEVFFSKEYNQELGQYEKVYTELGNLYYGAAPRARSKELAEYGVSELCLMMDAFYGLGEAHGIQNFYQLIISTGLLGDLLDPDPLKADQAVATLIDAYLDDQHSAYLGNSALAGKDGTIVSVDGYSSKSYNTLTGMYKAFQDAVMPEGRPVYQEVGDTAYVTFDEFIVKRSTDYYGLDLDSEASIQDTISLMMFAHHQITREDSPIRNVVLDLTMNSGGNADAAIFVIGWFLGEAQMSLVHTFTGARATNVYKVDVNQDRVFDDKDSIYANYNLYCLISPLSFSCGNLVPWAFHASGMVTLIGDTSGGGSCIVQPMATAWGTIFQTSSPKRFSFVRNGSYYDIDQGVTPDVHLSRTRNYFDREAMTAIIHDMP